MITKLKELDRYTTGLIGLLLSPLVAAIISTLSRCIEAGSILEVSKISDYIMLLYLALGPQLFIIGVPLFLFLSHFKLVNVWTSIIASLGFTASIASFTLHGSVPWDRALDNFLETAHIGIGTGIVFWLIWKSGKNEI